MAETEKAWGGDAAWWRGYDEGRDKETGAVERDGGAIGAWI
jgi:hypothetical protein